MWSMGHIANGIVGFHQLDDSVHDFAQAFSDPNQLVNWGKFVSGMKQGAEGVIGGAAMAPISAFMGIGSVDREVGGYLRRGATLADAWNAYNPSNGMTFGVNSADEWHKKLLDNWGNTNSQVSFGQMDQALTVDNALLQGYDYQKTGHLTTGGWSRSGQETPLQTIARYQKMTDNTLINPFNQVQRDKFFTSPGAPWKTSTGIEDAITTSVVDPLLIAGPALKAARIATMVRPSEGSEALGFFNNFFGTGSVSRADQAKLIASGVEKLKTGLPAESLAEGATMQNMKFVVDGANPMELLKLHDGNVNSDAISFIQGHIGQIPDHSAAVDAVGKSLFILKGLGTETDRLAQMSQLGDIFRTQLGTKGNDISNSINYALKRGMNGITEAKLAMDTGSDLIDHPQILDEHQSILNLTTGADGPMADRYATALHNAATTDAPFITREGPLFARIVRAQQNAAVRSVSNLRHVDDPSAMQAVADNQEPFAMADLHQLSMDHPTVAIVKYAKNVGGKIVDASQATGRFFSVMRPSYLYDANNSNHWVEGIGYTHLVNDLTAGEFAASGEAQKWADQIIGSQTPAIRIQTMQALEEAGVNALYDHISSLPGWDTNITKADIIANFKKLTQDRTTAIQRIKDRGFLSLMDGDSPVISVHPYLQRGQGNVLPLFDLKKLHSVMLSEGRQGVRGGGVHWLNKSAIPIADTLNNAFKISALLRVGYAIRNVGEAYLSTAASGYLFKTLGSFGAENAKTLLTNTKQSSMGIIDKMGRGAGFVQDLPGLRARQASLDMERGATRAAGHVAINDAIGKTNFKTTPEEYAAVRAARAYRNPSGVDTSTGDLFAPPDKATQALAKEVENRGLRVAEIQATHASGTTYHVSLDGEVQMHDGLLSGTPSLQRAQSEIDKHYVMYNGEQYTNAGLLRATATNRHQSYDAMLQDVRDQAAAGARVEVHGTTGWRLVTQKQLDGRVFKEVKSQDPKVKQNSTLRETFRVLPADIKPHIQEIRTFGRDLDATKFTPDSQDMIHAATGKDGRQAFNDFHASRAWTDPAVQAKLTTWAKENGYARIAVKDEGWGTTVLNNGHYADVNANGNFRDPGVAYGKPSLGVKNFASYRWSDAVMNHEADLMGNLAEKHGWLIPGPDGRPVLDPSLNLKPSMKAVRSDNRQARRDRKAPTKSKLEAAQLGGTQIPASGLEKYSSLIRYESAHALVHDGPEQMAKSIWENGWDQTARGLASKMANQNAEAEWLRQQVAAREQQIERRGLNNARANSYSRDVTENTHYGPVTHEGFSHGTTGEIYFSKVGAEHTVDKTAGDGNLIMNSGPASQRQSILDPNDPRYFEGRANVLNHMFRDSSTKELDPIVKRILAGEHPDAIAQDLISSPQDVAYVREFLQYHHGNIEDATDLVHKVANSLHLYAGEPEVLDALRNKGEITTSQLRDWLTKPTPFNQPAKELPQLAASLLPMSAEGRHQMTVGGIVNNGTARIFRFLSAIPENVLARHPLANAVYNENMRHSLNYAMQRRAEEGLSPQLTLGQINALQDRSREVARRQVMKTLFTIEQRSSAARSLRFVFPFYTAWDNVLRRWGGFMVHTPESVAFLADRANLFFANSVITNNQTGQREYDYGKAITHPQDYSVMLPQWTNKALGPMDAVGSAVTGGRLFPKMSQSEIDKYTQGVTIASPDVMFQGMPWNPGIGPMMAAPLAAIVDSQPSTEKLLSWAFPVGVPSGMGSLKGAVAGTLKMFLPATINKLTAQSDGNLSFDNAMNRISQFASLQVKTGQLAQMPTAAEIRDMTAKFWGLRILAGVFMPYSATYNSPVTWYASTLRQMRATAVADPSRGLNASQVADIAFLDKHPEAFAILPSLSQNSGGGYATAKTVDNQQKYKDVLALGSSLGVGNAAMSFVENYGQGQYNPADFSQVAYNWQAANGPTQSGGAYRDSKDPTALQTQAYEAEGWTQFNKIYGEFTAEVKSQGVDPNAPNLPASTITKLGQVRKTIANAIFVATGNTAFRDAFVNKDNTRFDDRNQFYGHLLGDKQFMADHGNDPVVKSIAAYLTARGQVSDYMISADQQTGDQSYLTLTSSKNAVARQWLQSTVQDLMNRSIAFSDWYHQTFLGDTVVASK